MLIQVTALIGTVVAEVASKRLLSCVFPNVGGHIGFIGSLVRAPWKCANPAGPFLPHILMLLRDEQGACRRNISRQSGKGGSLGKIKKRVFYQSYSERTKIVEEHYKRRQCRDLEA